MTPDPAPPRTGRTRRRHLAVDVLAAFVLILGLVLAVVTALGGDDSSSGADRVAARSAVSATSRGAGAEPTTTTPTAPTVTTMARATDAPLPVDRTYSVLRDSRTFVDANRTTSPNGSAPGSPERTLPTSFWYPDAPGPFPLVVFAHGYAVTPDYYAAMLERWAAAGYVVAAPTYPILSGIPGGASQVDETKTFGDTSFVISQIQALGGTDPIAQRIAPDRIAVAGHSDGEVIAFGTGFFQCCHDPRVDSVIAMAGNLGNIRENPFLAGLGLPVLHVMETGDEYDPYGPSIEWDRANLPSPRWMLTLEGTSHVPPYTSAGDAHFEQLQDIVVDFLDGTLKGHPERLDRIAATVDAHPDLLALER